MNMVEHYNIKDGDVYAATDGSGYTIVVVDAISRMDCDDVIVADFKNGQPVVATERRIDAFKLHMVRYSKVKV